MLHEVITPSVVRISQIKYVISNAGYTPLESQRVNFIDEDKLRKEKEIKTLWRKFIVSAFSRPEGHGR